MLTIIFNQASSSGTVINADLLLAVATSGLFNRDTLLAFAPRAQLARDSVIPPASRSDIVDSNAIVIAAGLDIRCAALVPQAAEAAINGDQTWPLAYAGTPQTAIGASALLLLATSGALTRDTTCRLGSGVNLQSTYAAPTADLLSVSGQCVDSLTYGNLVLSGDKILLSFGQTAVIVRDRRYSAKSRRGYWRVFQGPDRP